MKSDENRSYIHKAEKDVEIFSWRSVRKATAEGLKALSGYIIVIGSHSYMIKKTHKGNQILRGIFALSLDEASFSNELLKLGRRKRMVKLLS